MTAIIASRITLDPGLCHGQPCIRGLRYPVAHLLGWLAAGMSPAEILEDYPDLELADIHAALAYAARLAEVANVMPIAA